jgi:hypothetical protein
MSELRIDKDRQPVTLTLAGGTRISGEMFVQAHARRRIGKEEPVDVLNDAEPFFPFATDSGETLLIAKDRVMEVVGDVASPELEAVLTGRRLARIELVLTGGETHSGIIYLDVAIDRPRLLDFLNHYDQRFIVLHGSDGLRLINRALVESVRPLD